MLEADKTSNGGYSIFAVNVSSLCDYREREKGSHPLVQKALVGGDGRCP